MDCPRNRAANVSSGDETDVGRLYYDPCATAMDGRSELAPSRWTSFLKDKS